jgi:hypothetical protein
MSETGQQREPNRDADGGDPDVLLDVPTVSVDSIRLAVDGLEADLSLRARVANLLQVDAGVRVRLNGGELDVNGVHAEAQLRVRLEQLTRVLGRALDSLDNNPHLIEALARTAAADVDRSAQQLAAGAAEVRASARHSDDVRDEPGRQVGGGGPLIGGDRPGSGSGSGRPEPGRPGLDQPEAEQADAGRSGAGPGSSAPGAAGPGPRAGRPGTADQPHPQERQPQGREPGAGPSGGHRPEAQRHDSPRHTGEARNEPGQSAVPGPSPSGDGDGGLPGAAQTAAQSAAQLAEQAGETLRQAGRSVWEAIQGSVAQHRPQGRRDH